MPSQALVPTEVRMELIQIRDQISHVDSRALVQNTSSIRARFGEIKYILPEALIRAIHPVAFIEYRLFDYLQAQSNISECAARC